MASRWVRRILCATVLAALLAVIAPAAVFAGGVSAKFFGPDAYEPDDTTATTHVLPTESSHTIGSATDTDTAVVGLEATLAPVVVDIQPSAGFIMPGTSMERLNSDGSLGPSASVGLQVWGGLTAPYSFLYRAPEPGTYFFSLRNAFPNAGAAYQLYVHEGLARRISGADRFATAARISRRIWPDSIGSDAAFDSSFGAASLSPTGCILATGRGFADALTAGAWGGWGGLTGARMPTLLTERDILPTETASEIERLAAGRRESNAPFTVYVVGGTAAVDDTVVAQVRGLAGIDGTRYVSQVVRVAGSIRYETAVNVAEREATSALGLGDTAFIVNGFAFADGLGAGPLAAGGRAPILLTAQAALPSVTRSFLLAHPAITKAVVVGSPTVVGTAVSTALGSPPLSLDVTRVAGADRYATARALAKYGVMRGFVDPFSYTLVTGADFPDGLAATQLGACTREPTLLTRRDHLSSQVASFYADSPALIDPSWIVGGPSVISPTAEQEFNDLWKTAP